MELTKKNYIQIKDQDQAPLIIYKLKIVFSIVKMMCKKIIRKKN